VLEGVSAIHESHHLALTNIKMLLTPKALRVFPVKNHSKLP